MAVERRKNSKFLDLDDQPRYSLPYENLPPFPPPNVEIFPGLPPPPTASGFPGSRKNSRVPEDIPGMTKLRKFDPNGPEDRFYFVLITMFFIGLTGALPMSFFQTANEYWMYKFRTIGGNNTDPDKRNFLQSNYPSIHLMATTITGTFCNFASAFVAHKIRLKTRALSSMVFYFLNFVVQTIFIKIDTDSWQNGFFGFTVMIHIAMAVCMAVAGTGVMALVAKFPESYLKTFLLGQGVASVVSALMRLITLTMISGTLNEALLYFITGTFVMGAGLVMFIFATRTEFYKHYMISSKEDAKRKTNSMKVILGTCKMVLPVLLLNFFNMIFPTQSVTNLVISEYKNTGSTWGDKYFVTVVTYLIAAICELGGRGLSTKYDNLFTVPYLFVFVIAKSAIFGSIMMFTRTKQPRNLPIVFGHDWQYGLITAVYQLTGGYLANVLMLQSFKLVPKEKFELSIMIMMFTIGIFLAVNGGLGVIIVTLL